ncbi:unnamed protein product [Vitrella brassicaformis CCMP3155]|uniref:Uncharacterized protein n=1 Tax=Vitrella brassicaformis (strain CCMP3155) TaxID=1169540 RepID=A0A0G4EG27_VITBC|nr:unnamed protein product [Vitrella brassicaformis CCMP3155]|eukprot:CEL94336.1 unnamed protein product [Vitrella brassicaformis CCMP3155]
MDVSSDDGFGDFGEGGEHRRYDDYGNVIEDAEGDLFCDYEQNDEPNDEPHIECPHCRYKNMLIEGLEEADEFACQKCGAVLWTEEGERSHQQQQAASSSARPAPHMTRNQRRKETKRRKKEQKRQRAATRATNPPVAAADAGAGASKQAASDNDRDRDKDPPEYFLCESCGLPNALELELAKDEDPRCEHCSQPLFTDRDQERSTAVPSTQQTPTTTTTRETTTHRQAASVSVSVSSSRQAPDDSQTAPGDASGAIGTFDALQMPSPAANDTRRPEYSDSDDVFDSADEWELAQHHAEAQTPRPTQRRAEAERETGRSTHPPHTRASIPPTATTTTTGSSKSSVARVLEQHGGDGDGGGGGAGWVVIAPPDGGGGGQDGAAGGGEGRQSDARKAMADCLMDSPNTERKTRVVIDACNAFKSDRQNWTEIARDRRADSSVILYVMCSPDTCIERSRQRNDRRGPQTEERIREMASVFQPPVSWPMERHVADVFCLTTDCLTH